jgi:hypothetical protein
MVLLCRYVLPVFLLTFSSYEGFVVFEISTGSSFGRYRGRGKPEVTSPIDSSTPLLYQWSVDILCLSLSVQKLFNIFV